MGHQALYVYFTKFTLVVTIALNRKYVPYRHHGQIILQELALHNDFLSLWTNIVPEKDRLTLNKILKAKR